MLACEPMGILAATPVIRMNMALAFAVKTGHFPPACLANHQPPQKVSIGISKRIAASGALRSNLLGFVKKLSVDQRGHRDRDPLVLGSQ
jgi:hypothetical protein